METESQSYACYVRKLNFIDTTKKLLSVVKKAFVKDDSFAEVAISKEPLGQFLSEIKRMLLEESACRINTIYQNKDSEYVYIVSKKNKIFANYLPMKRVCMPLEIYENLNSEIQKDETLPGVEVKAIHLNDVTWIFKVSKDVEQGNKASKKTSGYCLYDTEFIDRFNLKKSSEKWKSRFAKLSFVLTILMCFTLYQSWVNNISNETFFYITYFSVISYICIKSGLNSFVNFEIVQEYLDAEKQ